MDRPHTGEWVKIPVAAGAHRDNLRICFWKCPLGRLSRRWTSCPEPVAAEQALLGAQRAGGGRGCRDPESRPQCEGTAGRGQLPGGQPGGGMPSPHTPSPPPPAGASPWPNPGGSWHVRPLECHPHRWSSGCITGQRTVESRSEG